jgi:hypothetical protein
LEENEMERLRSAPSPPADARWPLTRAASSMWAFSDESERADRMLVGVVLVPTGALDAARAELRGLLLAGQRRIHTGDESPRRRRVLLDVVSGLDAAAIVLRLRRSAGTDRLEARRRLLAAACTEVCGCRVGAWILDDTDPAQRARDRRTIGTAHAGLDPEHRPVYGHQPGYTEPMLWAADALCWAVGAGRDWRRRVAAVVEVRDLP